MTQEMHRVKETYVVVRNGNVVGFFPGETPAEALLEVHRRQGYQPRHVWVEGGRLQFETKELRDELGDESAFIVVRDAAAASLASWEPRDGYCDPVPVIVTVAEHLEGLVIVGVPGEKMKLRDMRRRWEATVAAERLLRLLAEEDPIPPPQPVETQHARAMLGWWQKQFLAAGGISMEVILAAVEDHLRRLAEREDVESVAADLAEAMWVAEASHRVGGASDDDLSRLAVRVGEGVAEVAGRLPELWSWASRWIAVYGLNERHPALDAWLEELAVRSPARLAFERAVRRPSAERVRVLAERAAERLARNLEEEER